MSVGMIGASSWGEWLVFTEKWLGHFGGREGEDSGFLPLAGDGLGTGGATSVVAPFGAASCWQGNLVTEAEWGTDALGASVTGAGTGKGKIAIDGSITLGVFTGGSNSEW